MCVKQGQELPHRLVHSLNEFVRVALELNENEKHSTTMKGRVARVRRGRADTRGALREREKREERA